jgi:hypothetical protein
MVIGGELIESVNEQYQRLLRGRQRKRFSEHIFELVVIDGNVPPYNLATQAGEEIVAARRFGRRPNKAPDHPGRALVLLRGLCHDGGLAGTRLAVQNQRLLFWPANVIRNCF